MEMETLKFINLLSLLVHLILRNYCPLGGAAVLKISTISVTWEIIRNEVLVLPQIF